MARGLNRGEIWMHRFRAPDKRRPILVLTRQSAIQWLDTVMVAPVTSTIRGLPSEVIVGPNEGLKRTSAVNLDHVQTVERSTLTQFVGTVPPETMRAVCHALAIATGCSD